jgi:membrane protein YqaA with SNARE-associated domain
MKLFGPLYERTIALARHPRAPIYLVVLSFFEAIIFPIMPEVMLVPMCVAKPRRAFWFAAMSLAGSMVGALIGYFLGHYAFEALKPMFAALGMLHGIESGIAIVQAKMAESPWAVFTFLVLGGFMPIPMKVFTWASGIVGAPSACSCSRWSSAWAASARKRRCAVISNRWVGRRRCSSSASWVGSWSRRRRDERSDGGQGDDAAHGVARGSARAGGMCQFDRASHGKRHFRAATRVDAEVRRHRIGESR